MDTHYCVVENLNLPRISWLQDLLVILKLPLPNNKKTLKTFYHSTTSDKKFILLTTINCSLFCDICEISVHMEHALSRSYNYGKFTCSVKAAIQVKLLKNCKKGMDYTINLISLNIHRINIFQQIWYSQELFLIYW